MITTSKSRASSAAIDGRGRSDGVDLIAFAFQQQAQRFQHVGLIVGDQDARRRGTVPFLHGDPFITSRSSHRRY